MPWPEPCAVLWRDTECSIIVMDVLMVLAVLGRVSARLFNDTVKSVDSHWFE